MDISLHSKHKKLETCKFNIEKAISGTLLTLNSLKILVLHLIIKLNELKSQHIFVKKFTSINEIQNNDSTNIDYDLEIWNTKALKFKSKFSYREKA